MHIQDSIGKSKYIKTGLQILVVLFIISVTLYVMSSGSAPSPVEARESEQPPLPTVAKLHVLAEGLGFEIFIPVKDHSLMKDSLKHAKSLIAAPELYIEDLVERYHYLDKIVEPMPPTAAVRDTSALNRARQTYIDLVKSMVSGKAYGASEKSADLFPGKTYKAIQPNATRRTDGEELPYLGETMIGQRRLDSLNQLLVSMLQKNIAGDVMETGVWRGGIVILSRAILRSYLQPQRNVFVCDSFRGLPPGNASLHVGDVGWSEMTYSSVDHITVARNFHRYQLLDDHVIFAKGYFSATMPVLTSIVSKLVLLRLDGDMYQSTVDVLYHMYDKVSLGGIIILDDWTGFPAQQACLDFFKVHGINPSIMPIDNMSVYWIKNEEVKIQYWRYQQGNFKP